MTSCHVSLKPKIGPVTAHATTMQAATAIAWGVPTAVVMASATRRKRSPTPCCRSWPSDAAPSAGRRLSRAFLVVLMGGLSALGVPPSRR